MKKVLIIGNGYIANRLKDFWPEVDHFTGKINSEKDALQLLKDYKPDSVLNTAGVTGKPNVDWCETHQFETVAGNVELPLNIAKACQKQHVYLLHMGTGCIFYGKSPTPEGWRESDFANPVSFYSKSKYVADLLLSGLDNIGIARIRLPIDDVPSEKNILTRLIKYQTLIDVENSLTQIEDMSRIFKELLQKQAVGIFHCTQNGSIKYRDIIKLYQKHVDPGIQKEWIPEEDLVKKGMASKNRATNILKSTNLEKLGLSMKESHTVVEETIIHYAANLKKNINAAVI